VLLTFGLILGVILLLSAAAYWYVQKYGADGPFPNQHGH
jgi:hypothetical protein